ncbi:Uncharacterized protein dnm_019210 [Desulfonema magnum]|uniref:Uncharacterized protein n=1 Tax=Desulfonema magnum TaxID=45655 RepID=A0A975GLR4_9BACT|nr:Uncharacterized protein dnm_019210 [Desulfonema magnum]
MSKSDFAEACESRNPFFTDAAIPGAVDSCFRRNDRKKFDHRVIN